MNATEERVARAIWNARADHFGEPSKAFVADERWELCLSYARAAIGEIRAILEEGYLDAPASSNGRTPEFGSGNRGSNP